MRFSAVFALALPAVTIATAIPRDGGSCSTGSLQCCNSVQSASDPAVAALAGLLGIALGSITGLVGLTCDPITVIGAGGTSCNAQTVCCTDNSFNGLIALGCTPVNVNL